ncbi:MAG: lysylphosphatidylglycerol synthase transmembrane domain-containing protein [Chitinivibrionales bacterium]|nr:lysylphosphatidylglycerol synthase transmembrane domain-containing protein [Chitinivibrionales bacterium]
MRIPDTNSFALKIPAWIKYPLAAVPIVWIFWHIKLPDLIASAHSVAWWTIPVYTAIVLLSMSLQGVRWWMLARVFIPSLSFGRVMASHFTGLFYSIALPGNASQDIIRAMLVSKGNSYSVIWGSTWVARILGLFALAALSLYGLLTLDKATMPRGFLISVLSAFVVFLLLCSASFSKRITNPGRNAVRKILPPRFLFIIENIREGIYQYKHKKTSLVLVAAVTLLMQLALVSAACCAIKGITGRLLISECLAYIPLIELLCISLPLTPNGIGIRESLLGVMFLHIGLSKEQLGIYILFGFYSILLKITGVIPVLFGSRQLGEKKNNILL